MKNTRYIALAVMTVMTMTAVAQPPNWSINPADYQYTMSITGVVVHDCELATDPADMVGAFVDGDLRGLASLNVDINGTQYAYLTVYSNDPEGESIDFQIYDATANQMRDIASAGVFEENGSLGNAADPFEFKTGVNLTELEISETYLYLNDQTGDEVAALSTLDGQGDPIDALYSFVDDAEGPDNDAFTIAGNTLVLMEDIDYNAQNLYKIHVLAKSGTSCSVDRVIDLEVQNSVDPDYMEELGIPNYMSPNNDGLNDYFTIVNVHLYSNYSLSIFNDNGNMVFSVGGDYNNDWAGTAENGRELPTGVYYYYLVNNDNASDQFTGKVFIQNHSKF